MIRIFLILSLSILSLYLYSHLREFQDNVESYKDLRCQTQEGFQHHSSVLNLETKEFSCYYIENSRKVKIKKGR